MKKIIFLIGIFVIGFVSSSCFAQDYRSLLTNNNSKTWRLTNLMIGGKQFVDTDSTCVYQLSVTFKADSSTYLKTIPCATGTPTEKGVFSIVSDSLTFSRYTVKITNITANQFETSYLSGISGKDSTKTVVIVQQYQSP
jgi:hypothetical protein